MTTLNKRTPVDFTRGIFQLCHPLPVLFHTLAVTLFVLLATWPHFNWTLILFAILAHVAMQLAIAFFNDYCDRALDAISKPDKPLVSGLVTPREALILGLLLIALMFFLLLPLNPLALYLSLLYLALGMSYNFGLKSTPLSGIVFALAIPLIPVYAFAAVDHIVPFLFWLIPVAALLGVVLNLANSLPDIEADAAQHARTLAVVLGLRGTSIACTLLILAAILLIAILSLTHLVTAQPWICLTTLFLATITTTYLLLLSTTLSLPAATVPTVSSLTPLNENILRNRKHYFTLTVFTCLILAAGWLTSILI